MARLIILTLLGFGLFCLGLVAATTGGARAQETPTRYEYTIRSTVVRQGHVNNVFPETMLNEIAEADVLQGWELAETHVAPAASWCYPIYGGRGDTNCEYYSEWSFVLRRPRQ